MNKSKFYEKIRASPKNVKLKDMKTLINAFGFQLARINGSHHIYIQNLAAHCPSREEIVLMAQRLSSGQQFIFS